MYKKLLFQMLIISSFLTKTTICSEFEQQKTALTHFNIKENTGFHKRIIHEYKHGNTGLSLDEENNIVATNCVLAPGKILNNAVLHMGLFDYEAELYKEFREDHLKGQSAQHLPRPKAQRYIGFPRDHLINIQNEIAEIAKKPSQKTENSLQKARTYLQHIQNKFSK